MGLETVINEVEQGGERDAQTILDEAKTEAGEILATANAEAAEYERTRSAAADRDAAQIEAQGNSHAEFEARKLVLETEAELRKELRAKVLSGFAGFSGPLRESHLRKLVDQAKQVIPKGKVWGASADKKFLSDVDGYTFSGETDIAGGLIVEDTKGKVRVDLSYDTLLDGLWRDILRSEADLFR